MAKHLVGCTLWSLAVPGTVASIEKAADLGFKAIQFTFQGDDDLKPDNLKRIRDALARTGLKIPGGMVGFAGEDYSTIAAIRATGGFMDPADFPARLARCKTWAMAMADLGLTHVTTHVGFIPEPSDAAYGPFMQRLGTAVDALHAPGLTVGFETGQESAEALLKALDALGRDFVSVNYDPANFVLYGSDDPVRAAGLLGPRTRMAHMKDGTQSAKPGEVWGEDVPLGTGAVDFRAVLAALEKGGFTGALIIEREAGSNRAGDIAAAKKFLEALMAE
jgi:sugar phosphate isomerase/epimerase